MPIESPVITPPGIEPLPEASFYVPATEPTTRLRRTMKHDDCFLVFDSHGDIGASPGGGRTACSIATHHDFVAALVALNRERPHAILVHVGEIHRLDRIGEAGGGHLA